MPANHSEPNSTSQHSIRVGKIATGPTSMFIFTLLEFDNWVSWHDSAIQTCMQSFIYVVPRNVLNEVVRCARINGGFHRTMQVYVEWSDHNELNMLFYKYISVIMLDISNPIYSFVAKWSASCIFVKYSSGKKE